MTYGRGKSDSVIVAMKLANKADRSAAELVERRTGTKGNVEQHSTRRALNRISMQQALRHIRHAALRSLRSSPEVGAVCLNWARTDLCGGRSAMSVPTATLPILRGCESFS